MMEQNNTTNLNVNCANILSKQICAASNVLAYPDFACMFLNIISGFQETVT